jgi:hypothetical protein
MLYFFQLAKMIEFFFWFPAISCSLDMDLVRKRITGIQVDWRSQATMKGKIVWTHTPIW